MRRGAGSAERAAVMRYFVECPLLANYPPALLGTDLPDEEFSRRAARLNLERDSRNAEMLYSLLIRHPRLRAVTRNPDVIQEALVEITSSPAAPRWAPLGGGLSQLCFAAHLAGRDPIEHAHRLLENAARRRALATRRGTADDHAVHSGTVSLDAPPHKDGDDPAGAADAPRGMALVIDEVERGADALREAQSTEEWIASQRTPGLRWAAQLLAADCTADEVEAMTGLTENQQRPLRDWLKDRAAATLGAMYEVEPSRVRLSGKKMPAAEEILLRARPITFTVPAKGVPQGRGFMGVRSVPQWFFAECSPQERLAISAIYRGRRRAEVIAETGIEPAQLRELRKRMRYALAAPVPRAG